MLMESRCLAGLLRDISTVSAVADSPITICPKLGDSGVSPGIGQRAYMISPPRSLKRHRTAIPILLRMIDGKMSQYTWLLNLRWTKHSNDVTFIVLRHRGRPQSLQITLTNRVEFASKSRRLTILIEVRFWCCCRHRVTLGPFDVSNFWKAAYRPVV